MEENNKGISDADILQGVLDALDLKAYAFSQQLNYSHGTIYHILNGKNQISTGMIDRIVKYIPNVNERWLKRGELPILLAGKELQNQMNLFNVPTSESQTLIMLKRLLSVPDQLDKIENLVNKLIEDKENQN